MFIFKKYIIFIVTTKATNNYYELLINNFILNLTYLIYFRAQCSNNAINLTIGAKSSEITNKLYTKDNFSIVIHKYV